MINVDLRRYGQDEEYRKFMNNLFRDSKRNDIIQKRLEDYPMLKEQKCVDCEYFSDKEYYTDNSIFVSAVAFGSCTKCQRNITLTSPNTEAPDWCPIKKGEKE